ncbi:MAG: carboxypeptidase-like regulatory domain-containing protein [Flavobacterium sp.]
MRLLLLVLLSCAASFAQTLTGNVFNSADGQPLAGASVYLDGTTIAASTNAEGYFSIITKQQYNAALVVSFLGYEPYRIDNPYTEPQPIKINLVPSSVNLKVVEVQGRPQAFNRGEMLVAFRQQFLGMSPTAQSCMIMNEDDINLYYDPVTNVFSATSDKPVIIRNKKLEYDVSFDMVAFEIKFSQKTLDPYSSISSVIAGTSLFRDRSRNSSAYDIRRDAYRGSARHLLKTLASGNWEKSGFRLYKTVYPVTAAEYFEIADANGKKKVQVSQAERDSYAERFKYNREKPPHTLNVLDYRNRSSFFLILDEDFTVDRNGFILPMDALIFGGHIGTLKIGDLLPADYVYYE